MNKVFRSFKKFTARAIVIENPTFQTPYIRKTQNKNLSI